MVRKRKRSMQADAAALQQSRVPAYLNIALNNRSSEPGWVERAGSEGWRKNEDIIT